MPALVFLAAAAGLIVISRQTYGGGRTFVAVALRMLINLGEVVFSNGHLKITMITAKRKAYVQRLLDRGRSKRFTVRVL